MYLIMSESELVNILLGIVKLSLILHVNFVQLLGNVPTGHFYSPCETKTTLLHLSPTSSEVRSNMQSVVALVVDRSLEEVMICSFVTILKLINQ